MPSVIKTWHTLMPEMYFCKCFILCGNADLRDISYWTPIQCTLFIIELKKADLCKILYVDDVDQFVEIFQLSIEISNILQQFALLLCIL